MVRCVVIFSLLVHQVNNFLVNQLSHFSIDCHKQGKWQKFAQMIYQTDMKTMITRRLSKMD